MKSFAVLADLLVDFWKVQIDLLHTWLEIKLRHWRNISGVAECEDCA
jgi:hypothetical protein